MWTLPFARATSLSVLLCISAAAPAQVQRGGPVNNIPEDLSGDGVVDAADAALFVEAFVAQLATADLNQDSVLDQRDADAMTAALEGGKRVRVTVPEMPGHEVYAISKIRGVSFVVYRESSSGNLSYLTAPLGGRARAPGEQAEVVALPSGHALRAHFDEAGSNSALEYFDGSQFTVVPRSQADVAAMEALAVKAEADCGPLPPIGNCPGCVPLRPPQGQGDCEYLYSKWGLFCNCLADVWGCSASTGPSPVVTQACCFDPQPGSGIPDCDSFGVPNPNAR